MGAGSRALQWRITGRSNLTKEGRKKEKKGYVPYEDPSVDPLSDVLCITPPRVVCNRAPVDLGAGLVRFSLACILFVAVIGWAARNRPSCGDGGHIVSLPHARHLLCTAME